jgi:type IV pilus assembly protein PilC
MTTGVVEADSEHGAEQMLWQSDLTIISLTQKKTAPSLEEAAPSFFRVSRNDVIYFGRDMATLLSSGIAIIPALHMLYGRTSKKNMQRVIRQLIGDVETGSPFSEACAKHPRVFSPFFMRMVRVGEEVGNLELMLRQAVIHMEKEAAIASKVRGAMIYPTFVLSLAFVATGVVFGFVLPAMGDLFDAYGGDLPIYTRVMLGASNFFRSNLMFIIPGFLALVGAVWLYFRSAEGKRKLQLMLWRIPVMGKIVVMGTMSRLARTIATLLRGGITLVEGLDLTIQTADNVHINEALVKVRSDVHSGESMSQSLLEQPIFPPLFSQVVGVGEQSGRLEANLEVLADFYEMETDKAISRATGMLGPALIVVVGFIVGFIALSVITPIYHLVGEVGG